MAKKSKKAFRELLYDVYLEAQRNGYPLIILATYPEQNKTDLVLNGSKLLLPVVADVMRQDKSVNEIFRNAIRLYNQRKEYNQLSLTLN